MLFLDIFLSPSPRFRDAPTYAAHLLGSVSPTSNVGRTDGDPVESPEDDFYRFLILNMFENQVKRC